MQMLMHVPETETIKKVIKCGCENRNLVYFCNVVPIFLVWSDFLHVEYMRITENCRL